MITRITLVMVLLAGLTGCGKSVPDAPAVESISFEFGTVEQGTTLKTFVLLRVAATEVEGERISDPFYSLVLLPTGASVVPGSSAILDQASKAPDDTGACPDGRTFLRFNFKPGEIANPFHFSKFAAVLVFQIVADRAANETQIIADSALEPYADPCLTPLDSANASLSVLEN